ARFGLPVMKAVPVAGPADLDAADDYLAVADRLLFDAKPPKDMKGALPGGNALSFDWQLPSGRRWPPPWLLSGGPPAANPAAAGPKGRRGALPGADALSFDWQRLSGRRWPLPWMLSGGLTAENIAEAVRISGARAVDVSSGVEERPGRKDPARIAAFLSRAA